MDLQKYIRKKQRMMDKRSEELRLSIDGEVFSFHRLSDKRYFDVQSGLVDFNESKDSAVMNRIFQDMIYYSCDDLHSSELLSEFAVINPPDIVSELFSAAEINAIGASLLEFNGMADENVVKKL